MVKRRECEVIIDPPAIIGNVSKLTMVNHRSQTPEFFEFIIDNHVETKDPELNEDLSDSDDHQDSDMEDEL